jgi:hypothetical protein
VRAGTKDDVFVTLEWDKNIFGKISGRSGVGWESQDNAQVGGGN